VVFNAVIQSTALRIASLFRFGRALLPEGFIFGGLNRPPLAVGRPCVIVAKKAVLGAQREVRVYRLIGRSS
jgi:hypothetical protein